MHLAAFRLAHPRLTHVTPPKAICVHGSGLANWRFLLLAMEIRKAGRAVPE